jgi:hypothetical protein
VLGLDGAEAVEALLISWVEQRKKRREYE